MHTIFNISVDGIGNAEIEQIIQKPIMKCITGMIVHNRSRAKKLCNFPSLRRGTRE